MKTVAADGTGVEDLRQRIEAHWDWLQESGEIVVREQLRIANTLENMCGRSSTAASWRACPRMGWATWWRRFAGGRPTRTRRRGSCFGGSERDSVMHAFSLCLNR